MIELLNMDCMDYLKECDDNAFQLCIVDPPYGIGEDGGKLRTKKDRPNSYLSALKHTKKDWDLSMPSIEYFNELKRVSKNQIIWGANFFASLANLGSSCWVIWDKNIGGDQADGELAYTSFKTAIRIFKGHPFIGTNGGKYRIHPTQKPVKLYEWLLTNYAKEGDRILDTHGGSMSSAIACHNLNYDMTIIELDEDYFKAGKERLEAHQQQLR
ncbi:MAG: site-specific DNA-methyltransferase, partial [Aureispira sp.]|nr:site-specific DNA-methyltransferase [Aureispira sp.]